MASLQKTYTGDLTQSIAKKIIEIIFKKAAKKKSINLGGDSGQSSPNAMSSLVPIPKSPFTESESKSSESFNKGDLGKLARRDPFLKAKMIQERMRPMGKSPIINAERGFFPKAFSRVFNDGIKVRENKLGVFLEKVALSLSSNINTSFRSN
jgi:hypothetical protein